MKQPKKTRETVVSGAWKAFYETSEGKVAIGQLFKDFGFFDTPIATDHGTMARSIGQRDVLARISQLINLKPEQSIATEREQTDVLERLWSNT